MNRALNCVISGIALRIFIGLTSPQPAVAQCPSGWEQNQYRIASQDWTTTVQPVDISAIPGSNGNVPIGPGSQLATMGDGGAFLLNSSDHTIYHLTLSTLYAAPGQPEVTASYKISDAPPTPQFPINGTLQNIQVLGGLLYASTDAGSLIPLQSSPLSSTAGAFNFGNPVAGMTFDGQHLWAVSGGYLWQLSPAIVSSAGTTLPRVVNKYPMAGVTPGPLAFDGSYIWMLSNGNGVSQIDPSTGQQVTFVRTNYLTGTDLLFDGYDLWFGNAGHAITRMDPATATVTNLSAPGVSVFATMGLDRHEVWAQSASGIARYRGCDGKFIGTLALSSTPWQAVYDGTEHWITYKNTNMLSVR